MEAIRVEHKDLARPNGFKGKDGIGDRSPNQGWHGGNVSLDKHRDYNPSGRNFRNTDLFYQSIEPPHGAIFCGDEMVGLDVNTFPMKSAHFATFPPKLIEPCILAGTSEKGACGACGAPWERVVEKTVPEMRDVKSNYPGNVTLATKKYKNDKGPETKTTGWRPTCKCNADVFPCTVLDPFFGSGTTGLVAHKHGRKFVGIELSQTYLDEIAIPRIEHETKQLKLF